MYKYYTDGSGTLDEKSYLGDEEIITADVYVHIIESVKDEVANAVDNLFKNKKKA